jgi:hypothetical protein
MAINIKNIFKNSISAPTESEIWRGVFSGIGVGQYSDAIIKMVLAPIFDELKKVQFYADPAYLKEGQQIATFLNENYTTIFRYFFEKGFCALITDGKGNVKKFDNMAFKKNKSEYEIIISNPISAKTFEMDFFNKSSRELVAAVIENINTGLTAQKAITKILGQFTFFSKEKEGNNERVIPMTDAERAKFDTQFNNLFTGDNVGSAVHFTNTSLKRDTVLFPMDKLEIVDSVGFGILILAGVMNVPYDLIPITGKSTYANQAEAIDYLRTHTVSGIAENILELGRKVLKEKSAITPKRALDYKIIIDTNVHSQI